LFDIETLEHLKTYTTERPVNSAAISPLKDHVILGGGQEAIEVFYFYNLKSFLIHSF
jgi:translation initiation factor 3 subunit I